MYADDSAEADHVRAIHLATVVRLTPHTMMANIACVLGVLWSFYPDIHAGMWVWASLLLVICLATLTRWALRRKKKFSSASAHTVHRATYHAVAFSAAWAVFGLVWFADATAIQRMFIVALYGGMIGTAGFVLHPLPYASAWYVIILSLASLAALILGGDTDYWPMAILMCLYFPSVIYGSLSTWRHSTALIREESRSLRQEQMLSVLLSDYEQNAEDALWEIDKDGKLVHISPKLSHLLDIRVEQNATPSLLDILQALRADGVLDLEKAIHTEKSFKEITLAFHGPNGEKHIQFNGKTLRTREGTLSGWRGVVSDVTQKVQSANLLRQLAHTDPLTGLSNRFKFRRTLMDLVDAEHPLALLNIDLNRFQNINSLHGHNAGDEVLALVARRIKRLVGPHAVAARLGGDEFAVILSTPEDIARCDQLAQQVNLNLQEPFVIGASRIHVRCSVGFAVSTDGQCAVDDIMMHAEVALASAKAGGPGRCVKFIAELGAISQRKKALEQGLRQALGRQEIQLLWQPKVDLATWHLVGCEALMRWHHPQLGVVYPEEFIPIAEQSGMIYSLGSWALLEACRLHAEDTDGINVSVNVSPIQLVDESFLSLLQHAIDRYGLPPHRLELELTESVFLESDSHAVATMRRIREMGVKLSLDDFGTGYSSLSYLRVFPFDTLKIDRAFVGERFHGDDAHALVQMITGLAGTLKMKTVFEGVETHEQLQIIQRAGGTGIQGNLVATPMTWQKFLEFRAAWKNQEPTAHDAKVTAIRRITP